MAALASAGTRAPAAVGLPTSPMQSRAVASCHTVPSNAAPRLFQRSSSHQCDIISSKRASPGRGHVGKRGRRIQSALSTSLLSEAACDHDRSLEMSLEESHQSLLGLLSRAEKAYKDVAKLNQRESFGGSGHKLQSQAVQHRTSSSGSTAILRPPRHIVQPEPLAQALEKAARALDGASRQAAHLAVSAAVPASGASGISVSPPVSDASGSLAAAWRLDLG